MTSPWRTSLLLTLVTACGFPRPADVGDDAPGDASDPGITVHVSPTGDDANDGLIQPVRTLKRAIGLAAASTERVTIAIAAGRYGSATGELFPSTVPPDVTIAGPAGGGAILVGSKSEPGIVLDAGKLQDLEFEDFSVAITARGLGEIANVRVRTSDIALREETDARLTVSNLDITGAAGACARGIELNGNADLTATDITTRALGTTVLANDQATVKLTRATAAGDASCATAVFEIKSSKTFVLSDTLVDGGFVGITLLATDTLTQVMLANVVIRNTKTGINGRNAVMQMIGGQLSHIMGSGLDISTGEWSLANVAIQQNSGLAIYMQGSTLIMRGCAVIENGSGIEIGIASVADFGTVASPGNNTFQNYSGIEVYIDATGAAAGSIDAVGNTWKPGVQGADIRGMYTADTVILGPTVNIPDGNYAIMNQGWSLHL